MEAHALQSVLYLARVRSLNLGPSFQTGERKVETSAINTVYINIKCKILPRRIHVFIEIKYNCNRFNLRNSSKGWESTDSFFYNHAMIARKTPEQSAGRWQGKHCFRIGGWREKSFVRCQKGASHKIQFEILYIRGSSGSLYKVRMLQQRVLLLALLLILFVPDILFTASSLTFLILIFGAHTHLHHLSCGFK